MIEPGQANFISRDSVLALSKENGEVAMRVGRQLSVNYFKACEEIRMLGISRSPAEKFAKLLLSWYPEKVMDSGAQVKVAFTHSEIAEMIGTTRETVTRLFTDSQRRSSFNGQVRRCCFATSRHWRIWFTAKRVKKQTRRTSVFFEVSLRTYKCRVAH